MFSTSQVPILCLSHVTRQNTCSYKTEVYDDRTAQLPGPTMGSKIALILKFGLIVLLKAKGLSQDPQAS